MSAADDKSKNSLDNNSLDKGSDKTISAIVVSYFTGPLLARSIASLKAQQEISEIILVDNGNWDGAVEAAIVGAPEEGVDTPVTVITGHGNVGFATACNLGARAAKGAYLLFMNPDAILPQGGLGQFISDSEGLVRPWLIGPKLVDPDGGEQQGSRRATLTPWRAFVEATGLYALAPRHPYFKRFNLHTDECPGKICATPTISGACFFLMREDYFLIDGMDERYFLHVEDIDFCLRFGEAGGTVYYTPHLAVTHFKSSSRVNAMRVERRKTMSMLLYFRIHFADTYPAPFTWLVWLAVWGVFGVKLLRRALTRAVALFGFGPLSSARKRRARELATKINAR